MLGRNKFEKLLRPERNIGVGTVEKRKIMAARRKKLADMGFTRIEVTCHADDVDKVREFVASLTKQPPTRMEHDHGRRIADQP